MQERLQAKQTLRGCRSRAKFLGGSTQERPEAPKTLRRLSIPSRILMTLHARASGGKASNERVVDSERNSPDAPRKSVRTRRAANRHWSLRKLSSLVGFAHI